MFNVKNCLQSFVMKISEYNNDQMKILLENNQHYRI